MKLHTFARRASICYKTAWRWWKCGKIKGYQTETGTMIITEEISEQPGQERVVVYARVSANENRPNLDSQAECLCACAIKGRKVVKVVKEVGSGVNDGRKKLLALLAETYSEYAEECQRQMQARSGALSEQQEEA